ncbi:HofP DNA utilization family protein [Raoultella terrigena]|uniref:HofP DNA utilization family protein n=1 Tax=Raoultella terrigena TaxID=577 RepID=UPI0030E3F2C2
MRSKGWRLALLLSVPLPLAGEARDPFQPAEDRCQVAALTQWRYGGAIGSPQQWIGILQDSAGKWRRVRVNDTLAAGWKISLLTAEEIEITTGPGCDPLHWRWLREEKKDAMDKPVISAAAGGSGGQERAADLSGGR